MTGPTRPVLRYHGGKWRLAPWIISFFPPHRVYTEAYGGAGSVLLRKPRARMVEVYNDLDGEIVNFFRVLRDRRDRARLCELLVFTPYARAEFALSYEPADDPVEQARRTVVRSFQGFGSDSSSGAKTGFRANGNKQNTHPASDWARLPASLAAASERLSGVVLESRHGPDLIRQHDEPRTLHYADPPYPPESRSRHTLRTSKGYRHEMTANDHRDLATLLRSAEGMVVLSGYGCPLYDEELYPDWERHTRPCHADGARERVEVVWLNPACAAAQASRGGGESPLFPGVAGEVA